MRKPLLPLNWWAQYDYILLQLKKLTRSSSFIGFISIFLVFITILNYISGHKLVSSNYITLVNYSIIEEIVYRGILYNFFKKFNKALAYIGVSILFCLGHLSHYGIWHFIMSLLLIWIYEKYKTIIAPIILHIINNTYFLIFHL